MELENIERDLGRAQKNQLREELTLDGHFKETRYRWVMVGLSVLLMLFNGLMNNIIIPLQSRLAVIYGQSNKIVNISTILSFLFFSLMNVPANHILDMRGIRFGFLVGLSFYFVGILMACFVNVAFPMLIAGYLLFTIGQPFILNTPAKIATYWFFPKNRALATSMMVGANIIGSGIGFAIPALAVTESSEGNIARRQIFSLYLGYAITGLSLLIVSFFLARAKPKVSPSNIDHKQKLSFKQTFHHVKKDRNLWKFFVAYFLIYGSFQTFASSANFLLKPFDYSDIQISMAAIFSIVLGTAGAVAGSLYLKKTRKFKFLIMICTIGCVSSLVFLGFQLNFMPKVILFIGSVALLGFFLTPIVPISYEVGCEVAFPIGEAQITGILNGGSLIFAFIADSILTATVGFGTKRQSTLFMFILTLIISLGSLLYFFVKIDLKRKEFEENYENNTSPTKIEGTTSPQKPQQIEMADSRVAAHEENHTSTTDSDKSNKYDTLVEEAAL